MHCCRNCKFYDVSRGDDCNLRNTDPPGDKVRWNDCSEFQIANPDPRRNPPKISKADAKSKWDSLFKD